MKSFENFAKLQESVVKCQSHIQPFHGVCVRATSLEYANRDDILTGVGSKKYGGRWNPPQTFRSVYLSLNIETATAEFLGNFADYEIVITEKLPMVTIAVEVTLQRTLDFTQQAIRNLFRTRRKDLLSDIWKIQQEEGLESLTQAIGRACYLANIDGIFVPSARADGKNLVVFPANLVPPETWIRVIRVEQLPSGGEL